MTARKIATHNGSGDFAEYTGLVQSAGAASAGDVIVGDANGRIDPSWLPTGVGPENEVITASEALTADDFVNIFNNSGTANCRKADASASGGLAKRAHGYVLGAVASGGAATVYADGKNNQVVGLTAGEVFLSDTTPGKPTNTPPAGTGKIVQSLGVAVSANELNIGFGRPILLHDRPIPARHERERQERATGKRQPAAPGPGHHAGARRHICAGRLRDRRLGADRRPRLDHAHPADEPR